MSHVATTYVVLAVVWLTFPACGVSWKCMARGKNNSNEEVDSNNLRPSCHRQTKWPEISLHRAYTGEVAVILTCFAHDCLLPRIFVFDQQSSYSRVAPSNPHSLFRPSHLSLHFT